MIHAAPQRSAIQTFAFVAASLSVLACLIAIVRGAPAAFGYVVEHNRPAVALGFSLPTAFAVVWMLAGVSAIPTLSFWLGRFDFPINVFATWVFVGTVLALAACYAGRHVWTHGASDLWWVPVFLTGVLLLGMYVVAHALETWHYMRQGHG